jgi:hypothetical protein
MDKAAGVIIEMPKATDDDLFEAEIAKDLTDKVFFDDGRYWMQGKSGGWVSYNETALKRQLKLMGVRTVLTKEEKIDGESSPMDKLIAAIDNKERIEWAGALAGRRAGVYRMSGQLVLVTDSPRLIGPCEADPLDDGLPRLDLNEFPYPRESDALVGECIGWPNLGHLWRNLFTCKRLADASIDQTAEDFDQLVYFYGWLQRSLRGLYEDSRLRGHAMLIAGEPNCGKSLTIWILQQLFGGKIARPLAWIEGKTQFNKSMFKSPFLVVDDEGAKTRIQDRKILSAQVKQITAVMAGGMEGKGKDDLELEPFWRVFFATNLEEQNLLVFPPIDDDIRDKVQLFKGYNAPWPWGDHLSEDEIQATLLPELPYFLHWIFNEFKLPGHLYSQRFGLKNWLHPEIREKIEFLSPEVRVWNFIERTVLRASNYWHDKPLQSGEWKGSAHELEAALRDPENSLTFKEREKIPPAHPNLGKYLSALSKMPSYVGMLTAKRTGPDGRFWMLKTRELVEAEQAGPAQSALIDEETSNEDTF